MKHLSTRLLFLLCCFLNFDAVTGQAYNYAHYTTRDGLAGEILYTITQDAEGFMWFATETGLSRFDGRKFKNFSVSDGLPANEVFGFYEDTRQRLWIKSFSNEPCYYSKGKIHNKNNTPALQDIRLSAQLYAIIETKRGDIIFSDEAWNVAVLSGSGTVRNYKKGELKIQLTDVLRGHGIKANMFVLPAAIQAALYQYASGNQYFGNNAVITGSELFILVNKKPSDNSESWLWFDKNGRTKLIVRPERLHAAVLPDNTVLEAYRTGGAGIFDLKTERQTASFLPGLVVNGIYQDRDNNIWFGTKWDGLYKLSNEEIFSLSFNAGNKSPAVQFVHASNGKIFAGDDNGSFWCIPAAGIQQHYPQEARPNKKKISVTIDWLKKNALGRCINYNGSDFLHLNYKGASQGVKTLYQSGDTLLIAASDGVSLSLLSLPSVTKRIHEGRATCAIKVNDFYYVGTLNGLLVYDRNGKLVAKPLYKRISFITPGAQNELWVSTYDKGVYGLRNNHVTDSMNTGNSLLRSNIVRCVFYKDETIWAGTDKGICRMSLPGRSYKRSVVYNQNNGLNSDIINTIFVDDSMVYAGTAAGLNVFSDQVAGGDTSISLAFTQISVADTIVDLGQELLLPHRDNNISFDFSAISYATSGMVYQYRLIGLSDQWQTTTEQTLSFIALPSGKYRLQILALNPSGGKTAIIEKDFEVKQSTLEYWWVKLLITLLAGAVLVFFIYLRIQKIQRSESIKRETGRRMLELEQMALRAQMNPHFIFNCLNSVQHYILKHDAAGANLYLSQFAGLVRQTLENSSKLLITLQEEITYLKHYIELERLQVNYPFEYKIIIDPDLVTSSVLMPNMIIQPFVENALKHGLGKKQSGGYLSIEIRQQDGQLLWTISDNGPGIGYTKKMDDSLHKSRGVSLIEKRINTLNLMRPDMPEITFQIEDIRKSGEGGTRVTVVIPIVMHSPVNSQT